MNAALPYNLIDIAGAAPAANDYVAFGIDTTVANSGPFCSLVFDIGTAISGITLTWEYSTGGGAWAALTVQDNTNQDGAMTGTVFDTTGVNSVHWEQPAAWATQAVNLITGYWVRARVTAAPGPHTAPTQQHRDVYSVTWPYAEIEAEQILGDVPALLRINAHNQSGGAPLLTTNRLMVGLRSISRGTDFAAYINLADEQNHTDITVVLSPDAAFANDITAPTGRVTLYAPGVDRTIRYAAYVEIAPPLSLEYYGRFRALLRVKQSGGNAGDIGGRLEVQGGGIRSQYYSPIKYTQTTAVWETLDFGSVTLPSITVSPDENVRIVLIIDLANTNGAVASLYLYDLILIPLDEWAIDSLDSLTPTSTTSLAANYARRVDIDSIYQPKSSIRSVIYETVTDQIMGPYLSIAGGPAILQANAQQRLWFFSERAVAGALWPRRPSIELGHVLQTFHVSRYYSLRGNR
jgi:hypothetical protein